MTDPRHMPRLGPRGFSLIELAVVLFVVGLAIGSVLIPLSSQVQQRQIAETRKALDAIVDALAGFAAANGYLPCPDQMSGAGANDGLEDINGATGQCSVVGGTAPNTFATGNLPWITLGLGERDLWGNRYRYAVMDQFARRSPGTPPNLSTHSTSGFRVYTTNMTCPNVASTTQTTRAVVVVLSHGPNGYGAMNADVGATNAAPGSTDEIDNASADRDYAYRAPTESGTCLGEFDDVVTWMSRYTLLHRMVSAGALP